MGKSSTIREITSKAAEKLRQLPKPAKIMLAVGGGVGLIFASSVLLADTIGDKFEKRTQETPTSNDVTEDTPALEQNHAEPSPQRANADKTDYIVPKDIKEVRRLAKKMKLNEKTIIEMESDFAWGQKLEINPKQNSIKYFVSGGEWYPYIIENFYKNGKKVKVISAAQQENGVEFVQVSEFNNENYTYKKRDHNSYINESGCKRINYDKSIDLTSYYRNSNGDNVKISTEKHTPNSAQGYILELEHDEIVSGTVYDEAGNVLAEYDQDKNNYFDFVRYLMTREEQEAKIKAQMLEK